MDSITNLKPKRACLVFCYPKLEPNGGKSALCLALVVFAGLAVKLKLGPTLTLGWLPKVPRLELKAPGPGTFRSWLALPSVLGAGLKLYFGPPDPNPGSAGVLRVPDAEAPLLFLPLLPFLSGAVEGRPEREKL